MKLDLKVLITAAGLATTVVSAWVEMRVAVARLEAKATAIEQRLRLLEHDDGRTARRQ